VVWQYWADWSKKYVWRSRSYGKHIFCETCPRLANPARLGVQSDNVCSIAWILGARSERTLCGTQATSNNEDMLSLRRPLGKAEIRSSSSLLLLKVAQRPLFVVVHRS